MRLSEAVNGFYLYLVTGDYSPITAKNYKRLLLIMSRQLGDPTVEQIDEATLRRYLDGLKTKGDTASTQHSYWRTIRSFYNWASVELKIQRPDSAIPAPKPVIKTIIPFTREEVEALAKACKTKRDKALVLLLLDTGLRISEMCRLLVKDCDLESGRIVVRPWSTGKKSKSRLVRLGTAGRRAVWSYLASRDNVKPEDPLISTLSIKPLERYSAGGILERIGKRAGVSGVHPHKFRHTFAIQYLRNGGDIFTLQELLGHSSLIMVRHYLTLANSDVEAAHRRASPVDNWRL